MINEFEINLVTNPLYEPDPRNLRTHQRLTITADTKDVDALFAHIISVVPPLDPVKIGDLELTLDFAQWLNHFREWDYACYEVSDNSFQHTFTPKPLTIGRITNTSASLHP